MTIKTIPAAAKAAGVSETTIKRALDAGSIARRKDGTFDPRALRDGIAARAARRGGTPMGSGRSGSHGGGMPPAILAIKAEQAKEELELTRAKRMRAQQELAKGAGELILKGEALRAWAELMMNFRDRVLSIPEQVAKRCDKKTAREIAVILRESLEEVLRALAEGGARANGSLGK